jgi:hypothetical protein
MSDKILVIVKHLDELEPARAVLSAFCSHAEARASTLPGRSFMLSFFNEDLRTRFGETAHAASTDPLECVLSAESIGLVLCFSGARELGPASNFLLLNYFDELGVPTVELQRDLLRDPASARAQSTARHYLAWSGEAGTGYLREAQPSADARATRDNVVLVTSLLAAGAYSEEQRYQFAFSVMRLAREHPQLCFLWRASTAEEQSGDARQLLAMLGSSAPANLWLEENEPLDALLARASAVVTMAQTALLDYAAAAKPALVYTSSEVDARLTELSFARFTLPEQLLSSWRTLRAEPANFLIESRIPSFQQAHLCAELARIESTRARAVHVREPMLRYLAQMQDVRARADLGRLSPLLSALDKRVAEMEKQLALRDKPAAEGKGIGKNGKRQLSVAERAWKLARAVRARALK